MHFSNGSMYDIRITDLPLSSNSFADNAWYILICNGFSQAVSKFSYVFSVLTGFIAEKFLVVYFVSHTLDILSFCTAAIVCLLHSVMYQTCFGHTVCDAQPYTS